MPRGFFAAFLIEKIYLREINTLHKIPDRIMICVKRRGVLRYFIETQEQRGFYTLKGLL
jgi:hypothetical protein